MSMILNSKGSNKLNTSNRRYESEHPGLTISDSELFHCICPCIEPEVISDCACPECVDFECLVRALRDIYGCEVCAAGPWSIALASSSAMAKATSCQDEVIHAMRRSGSDEDFYMCPLQCCIVENEIPGLSPCIDCRVDDRLPYGNCQCFSEAFLSGKVIWLARQPTIEGKDHDRVVPRLRSYEGTVLELMIKIKSTVKSYLHHLWLVRFLRRQFHLDCDFFDQGSEAVILADFASKMVQPYMHHFLYFKFLQMIL